MKELTDNAKHIMGKSFSKEGVKVKKVFEETIIDMLNYGASINLGDFYLMIGSEKTFKVTDYQYFTLKEFETFRGAWNYMNKHL